MATEEEVRAEFQKREVEVKAALNTQMEEERQKRQAVAQVAGGARRGNQSGVMMGADLNQEESKEEESELNLAVYKFDPESLKNKHTKFFTTFDP